MNAILNGTTIRDRRHELGLATGAVAAHVGIPNVTLTAIENNADAAAVVNLPVGLLLRLADHLALPLRDLFNDEPNHDPHPRPQTTETPQPGDVDALNAVLLRAAETGQHANIAHVAEALGWTLTRVHATAKKSARQLGPAGLTVRVDKTVIHLTTTTFHRDTKARYIAARSAHTRAPSIDYEFLHKVYTEQPSLRKVRQQTIKVMATLTGQGLVQTEDQHVILTEAVLDALDPHRIPPD